MERRRQAFLVGFEELELETIVDNAPNASNGEGQAKSNTQPSKDPVKIPIEGVLDGLFNEDPHETRVREGDRKSKTA